MKTIFLLGIVFVMLFSGLAFAEQGSSGAGSDSATITTAQMNEDCYKACLGTLSEPECKKQCYPEPATVTTTVATSSGVFCDANTPCKEAQECWKFPKETTPICVEKMDTTQLCQKYCSATNCLIAESYPPKLVCPTTTEPATPITNPTEAVSAPTVPVSSDCFEYCVKNNGDPATCKQKCTPIPMPLQLPDDLSECVNTCAKAATSTDSNYYAECKTKCYNTAYGKDNCKKICEKDANGMEVCKELCAVAAVQATSGSAGEAQPIDPIWACVKQNCPIDKQDSQEYVYCKNKCYAQNVKECKEECEANTDGTKVCKKYCAVAASAPTVVAPINVAAEGRDKCVRQCKWDFEAKIKAIATENQTVPAELEKNLGQCVSTCQQSFKTAIASDVKTTSAPIAVATNTIAVNAVGPVEDCVQKNCLTLENPEEHAQCKNKCLSLVKPQALQASDRCAALTDDELRSECKKIQEILGLKKQCNELKGEERMNCLVKAYSSVLSAEDQEYQKWLVLSVNPKALEEEKARKEKEREQNEKEFKAKLENKTNELNAIEKKAVAALINEGANRIEQAANRVEVMKNAIDKAKAKGHDVTELEYLVEKYYRYIDSAKQYYQVEAYKDALKTIKEAESVLKDFKEILKKIVEENNAGVNHVASAASPVTVTNSVETSATTDVQTA